MEQIGPDGIALDLPKRCRVQARQIYVFAEAGRLGWTGPWRACVEAGLSFMLDRYVRPDGLMRFSVARDGAVVDDAADNYDQAFAIFALAHAARATGDASLRASAERILSCLRAARAHPAGGFYEGSPPAPPLRSNPHMHLFEAALAWLDLGPSEPFGALAAELSRLCGRRFVDPRTGALRELFALDWSPADGADGDLVEPGHQFEWSWLLMRWMAMGGDVDPATPERLYAHGARHGIDPARRVAINAVRLDGSTIDAGARLWPQTERMKAALALAARGGEDRAARLADAADAWAGLSSYAMPGRPGLYFDKSLPGGGFRPEPAFASSMYHIVCALSELLAADEAA